MTCLSPDRPQARWHNCGRSGSPTPSFPARAGRAASRGPAWRDGGVGGALAGKRRKGTPRPFGYGADHVTLDPDEAAAVRWAADCLLGGGTVSALAREWSARGLRPPQAPFGPLPEVPWKRNSVTVIM